MIKFLQKKPGLSSILLNRLTGSQSTSALHFCSSSPQNASLETQILNIPINNQNQKESLLKFQKNYLSVEYEEANDTAFYMHSVAEHVRNKKVTIETLVEEPMFLERVKSLISLLSSEKSSKKLHLKHKFSIILSLQFMGFTGDFPLVRSLVSDLIWYTKFMSVDETAKLLAAQISFQDTKIQKDLVEELNKSLLQNFESIASVETFTNCYKISAKDPNFFTKQQLQKIDENFANFLLNQNASLSNLSHVLTLLATTKRRPTPLIKQITHILRNDDLKQFSVTNLINLVSSLTTLTVPDINILSAAFSQLIHKNFIKSASSKDIQWLLKNMVRLRYKSTDLLLYLQQHLKDMPNDYLLFAEYLVNTAKLNYTVENKEDFENNLKILLENKNQLKPILYTELCWALAFHGMLSKEFLTRLINDKFIEKNLKPNPQVKTKLANLKVYCKYVLNLDLEIDQKFLEIEKQNTDKELVNTIEIDLHNVVLKKFTLNDIKSLIGITFDFGFIINKNFVALPVANANVFNTFDAQSYPDFKAVCIYTQNYKDVTINTYELMGEIQMSINLCKHFQFNVLTFSRNNYPFSLSSTNRKKFFKDQIEKLWE